MDTMILAEFDYEFHLLIAAMLTAFLPMISTARIYLAGRKAQKDAMLLAILAKAPNGGYTLEAIRFYFAEEDGYISRREARRILRKQKRAGLVICWRYELRLPNGRTRKMERYTLNRKMPFSLRAKTAFLITKIYRPISSSPRGGGK